MKKSQIVANVGTVKGRIVGRNADGDLLVDFVVVHQIAIRGVLDTDMIEYDVNNHADIRVNGVEISKKTLTVPKRAEKKIKWDEPMVIAKDGKIRYKKTMKSVF